MCGLCGSFAHGHWSDGVASNAQTPTAERARRAAVANAALAPFGLTLKSWGGRYVLSSRTGKAAVVEGFGDLWPAAEKLGGRSCDPLDATVLARLELGA
ncbi:hypothetical protein [Chenggangzhangella methanolivorans]|uniref:Uncharacterized protein n=1 Tax=Chenggangzhangella methanolivorans TaxID=1437009 RepID=A0A9E6R9Z1_9HYPH|nr:hypothetical protein [Chenggangzhangella methanolivorans]QZO00282.1 hypothetical protein K6K41_00270 [Chenggangzhangella methanolivorans]